MKIIISEQQLKRLIYEYNHEDSFLNSYDTAIKFAYENIDDVTEAFDNYDEDPNNIHNEFYRDMYIERIELYVDKYKELMNDDSVIIYRMIALDSIDNLDINNIGTYWSFELDGVGVYGLTNNKNNTKYTLEAIVHPKDIDWVHGFHSFIWYGEDQWECSLNSDAKVTIISINDKELDKPISATAGDKY